MAVSPYRVTPARIGNSSGLRLPAAFYRDHPQFAGAAGQVEVLDETTLLLRLEPEEQQQGEAEEDTPGLIQSISASGVPAGASPSPAAP